MIKMFSQTPGPGRLTKAKGVLLATLILGPVVLPLVLPVQRAQAQSQHREHSRNLLGSWIVQVTLDPNSVPAGTPLHFTALYTFSPGGGYFQSNTGPGAGGPPGQGNWMRGDDDKVSGTLLRFGFDAAHHFTGINKIREEFALNEQGDGLTGNVQVDVFLPDGTMLPVHPAGTYQGSRVEIEPLQ